ncbi:MAG: hypothetical protein LBU92_05085 [Prevotellaceae bacterium]|jgi:Spy/CpxP family protein refolding chaperone|nr:hypothetical protein [Prevotellaceae bacterium]
MKKLILLVALALTALSVAAHSPKSDKEHRERQEKIQARKAAYFTHKLELTPAEAQAFWPVYNEYWKKRDNLYMERQNLLKKIQSTDPFDDKKARQVTQRLLAIAQEEADILRKYSEKFAQLLPPTKLLRYYAAEDSFKLVLIDDLRKQEKKK